MSFARTFPSSTLKRAAAMLHIAVVVGLVVSAVAAAVPLAATHAAPIATSRGAPETALAAKRAHKRPAGDRHGKGTGHHKRQKPKRDHRQEKPKHGKRNHQPKKKKHNQKHQPEELTTGLLPAATAVAAPANQPPSAEDRYIVVLKEEPRAAADGEDASAMQAASEIAAADPGVVPTHVYENVFDGFAAVIPADQLAAVRNDPRVAAVVPDGVVYGDAQTLPTGVNRINADLDRTAKIDGVDERVDVDVAVLDTAFNPFHADINEWATANCTDTPVATDDHGHGTHVTGIIGALDNDFGVVGVAPGARIWNFRVLKATAGGGSTGLNSWIICGLDLVTRYANDQGDGLGTIEVANLSLGGPGADSTCADPFHAAFCRAVAAGITVIVAAGNDHVDTSTRTPAAYDEVITVSALADSDGQSGARGGPTSAGADDTLAPFSNFGPDVDIAAPGVDILSTMQTGGCAMCDPTGYGAANGTSMAAPHVTGVAALYLAAHAGATPAQVRAALLNSRELIALPNDPDGIAEGVLNLAAPPVVGPRPQPGPVVDAPGGSDHGKNGKKRKNRKNRKNRGKP